MPERRASVGVGAEGGTSKKGGPFGSTARIARTRSGRASATSQPNGPEREWVSTTAGPIRSSRATRSSRVLSSISTLSVIDGSCEAKNWSKVGSPAWPEPGHCVCSLACGQRSYFSGAVNRCSVPARRATAPSRLAPRGSRRSGPGPAGPPRRPRSLGEEPLVPAGRPSGVPRKLVPVWPPPCTITTGTGLRGAGRDLELHEHLSGHRLVGASTETGGRRTKK